MTKPNPGLSRRQLLRMLAAVGVPASRLSRAQDAAKVNPRSYKVVFENERLRVLEYLSRPGLGMCGNGRHTHPAHLSIPLTDSKVKVTTADGKVLVVQGKAGEMFWSPAETHTTENISGVNARAYMIELKDKDWSASTG